MLLQVILKKYFNANRPQAYASYWYYLHFNNVKNNDTNKNTKQVIDDYNAFYNTWKKYSELSDKTNLNDCLNIIFIIVLILVFIFFLIIICELCARYKQVEILQPGSARIYNDGNNINNIERNNKIEAVKDKYSDLLAKKVSMENGIEDLKKNIIKNMDY